MDLFGLGSMAQAAGAIAGSFMDASTSAKNRGLQERVASEQMNFQRQLATNGIRWKVEDAKAAGIHPVYAMGASTPAFNPVSLGSLDGTNFTQGLSAAGQGIGRAVHAMRPQEEKVSEYTAALRSLQLENNQLQNDFLRAQILRLTAPGTPPGLPAIRGNALPGQGNSPLDTTGIISNSMMPVVPPTDKVVPDVSWSRNSQGFHAVPSKDVKELIEDNLPQEVMHFIRNNILPIFGENMQPPYAARDGYRWVYHPVYGYRQVPQNFSRGYKYHPSEPRSKYWDGIRR